MVRDLHWYHEIAEKCFYTAFRQPGEYAWLGLLPSYLANVQILHGIWYTIL